MEFRLGGRPRREFRLLFQEPVSIVRLLLQEETLSSWAVSPPLSKGYKCHAGAAGGWAEGDTRENRWRPQGAGAGSPQARQRPAHGASRGHEAPR
jgi:hypothetical protein